MSDSSDPEKIADVKRVLKEAIPGAKVTHHAPGGFGAIEFRIEDAGAVAFLRVAWDRLQEDQNETEKLVKQAVSLLTHGSTWLLGVAGTLIPAE